VDCITNTGGGRHEADRTNKWKTQVLVDIQLPKLSGFDVTRRLRADPATASVPIIVITSFALSGDDQRAREAGASHYLSKPYSPRELLEAIRRLAPET
jgi:two-component system, cell cycle response regulator DivK